MICKYSYCTLLSNIRLPEGLTEVEYGAFSHSGLQTVTLPSTLTYIGEAMFYQCESLSTFTIPSTISEIRVGAFANCTNLRSVTIPESVKTIGNAVFRGTGLTEVYIPSGVSVLSDDVFEDCKKLQKVMLPEGLTTIGNNCFRDCEKLTDIVIPKTLATIYDDVFSRCIALKEITFSSSLESWGSGVFSGCTNLTALHVNRAIPPKGNNPYGYKLVVDDNNQCVLYVPTGSKALYEQTEGYQNFKEIREENVDGTIYYQVAANVTSGNGRVLVNGNYDYSGKYEIERQGNAVLTFEPSEGWMLGSVTVNGKNLTANVADNQLTLTSVEENMNVEVVFAEKPVVLTFKTADNGAIGISVEKGQSYTCSIQTEEEWKVNTVMFNGQDVTDQVVDNVFTTPRLTGDALLSVSFENTDTKVQNPFAESAMKAYTDGEGRLCIDGTKTGEHVLVATADGQLLLNTKSHGNRITLPLVKQGIYVVTTDAKTVKVMF